MEFRNQTIKRSLRLMAKYLVFSKFTGCYELSIVTGSKPLGSGQVGSGQGYKVLTWFRLCDAVTTDACSVNGRVFHSINVAALMLLSRASGRCCCRCGHARLYSASLSSKTEGCDDGDVDRTTYTECRWRCSRRVAQLYW